jgi:lipoprotein-anchoring transpeptidase ErfK/SrfK
LSKGPSSRRDFLKISALALASLAFDSASGTRAIIPPLGVGRVCASRISLRPFPSFQHPPIKWFQKNQLVPFYRRLRSYAGPNYNPIWYRVLGGYVHSGYLQIIKPVEHTPLHAIPAAGQICQVIAPFSQSYRATRTSGWQPLYMLYYQSTHWVTDLVKGPDNLTWAEITDERLRVRYHIPARHLRRIPAADLTPLSPHVPEKEKKIVVSLADQSLKAYEKGQEVFHTTIASGIPSDEPTENGIPTETPGGYFRVSTKMPVRHMGDGRLSSDPTAYELPGVPWVSTFVATGVAFHGTYWHQNFGKPMSHGCINMRVEEAQWLYRWTTPVAQDQDWRVEGRGTLVEIQEA